MLDCPCEIMVIALLSYPAKKQAKTPEISKEPVVVMVTLWFGIDRKDMMSHFCVRVY